MFVGGIRNFIGDYFVCEWIVVFVFGGFGGVVCWDDGYCGWGWVGWCSVWCRRG